MLSVSNYKNFDALSCVYKLSHCDTDFYYIGRTCNLKDRMRKHHQEFKSGKHKNPKMLNIHNKYGDKWYLEIMAEGDDVFCIAEEQRLLDLVDLNKSLNCHTNSIGGSKNQVWTKEQRERHSKIMSKTTWSDEQKANQSSVLSNSEKVRLNCLRQQEKATLAATSKEARMKAVETRRITSGFFSEEVRQKQRDKAKNKVFELLTWITDNGFSKQKGIDKFKCSWGAVKKYQPSWEALNGTLPDLRKLIA